MTGAARAVRSHLGSVLIALRPQVFALVIALLVGAVLLAASGLDPVAAYRSLFTGAFGSSQAWGRTLQTATPLILTGIAVAFAFRGGRFNIGGDGQFAAGAVVAAWLGVALPLPPVVGPVVVLLAAALAGGAVGGFAGILAARFGAHEVVTTIMLNFIILNLTAWLLLNPLSGHTQTPGSAIVGPHATLPTFGAWLPAVHLGLLVAILVAAVATFVLWKTPVGLELRVAGFSAKAAQYAGRSPAAAAVIALGVGGACAGLAGAGEVLGTYGHMTVPFVTNLGYLGIGVALLGRNHPIGCIFGGVVLGALATGGQQMQFDLGVSSRLTELLVGVILLCVTVTHVRISRPRWLRWAPATSIVQEAAGD